MPAAPQTLNELSHLQRSHFGRPKPRHGLRLLYWFAHEFIESDSNPMVATEHPDTSVFGFHTFHNRPESDGDALLPETESSDFYEVGNLNETDEFPDYVTKEYTGGLDNSNSDRIIVDMSGRNVYRVYVTTHSDQSNFSHSETYRISQGLISIIKKMGDVEDFLSKMDPHNMYQPYNRDQPKQAPVLQLTTPKQSAVSQSDNRERQEECKVTIDNGVENDSRRKNDSNWWYCIIL